MVSTEYPRYGHFNERLPKQRNFIKFIKCLSLKNPARSRYLLELKLTGEQDAGERHAILVMLQLSKGYFTGKIELTN